MIDIALNDVNKYYGLNHVLKGITFEVNSGERIGLLGKNGSGKTTLFKIITGEEEHDGGSVFKASKKKVEMLAQIPFFDKNDTVDDILRSAFAQIAGVYGEMKKIEGRVEPEILTRYGRLMDEYERLGGYEMEVRIDKICEGMNIEKNLRERLFQQLSGGEKARVNLARILLQECDVLLLDEPTNHLDLVSLEWLEKFLLDFPGTVVTISHDRVFLDRVVTRIIEIESGKANYYSGNYSFYVEERERRFLSQEEQYKQQKRKIDQLEAAIKRQRVWAAINPSNTGLAKRALAMEKRIEQMDKIERPKKERKMTSEFDKGGYAAKEIVLFDAVHKSYGSKILFSDLCLKIRRNDRIALIGENGCGKTTLMKIVMGEEVPQWGKVKVSSNVTCGYLPQSIDFGENHLTVLETFCTQTGNIEEKARCILARFKFMASDVMKKVGNLSGGEKSRLKLCLMMQDRINFLILDEPTNHLDIASREWIENVLYDFEGTMLFVSHDRFFLSEFADKVWSMKDGTITEYNCGFEEYAEAMHNAERVQSMSRKRKSSKEKSDMVVKKGEAVSIERLILEAETELGAIDAEIEADLSEDRYAGMKELYKKRDQLTERIEELYDLWMGN